MIRSKARGRGLGGGGGGEPKLIYTHQQATGKGILALCWASILDELRADVRRFTKAKAAREGNLQRQTMITSIATALVPQK